MLQLVAGEPVHMVANLTAAVDLAVYHSLAVIQCVSVYGHNT
jgi:hypothetical protein